MNSQTENQSNTIPQSEEAKAFLDEVTKLFSRMPKGVHFLAMATDDDRTVFVANGSKTTIGARLSMALSEAGQDLIPVLESALQVSKMITRGNGVLNNVKAQA